MLRKKSNLLPLTLGATKIHHLKKYKGVHEKRKIPSTKLVRLGLSWEGGAGWAGNESKDGILALTFLMKIIKIGKIFNFSYYCCGMGILMIILT